jgi:hypothetical protein
MNTPQETQLVPVERVESPIHLARGEKVLLDADLARLYDVTTGNLNKAVQRNHQRFPPDFMFQLSDEETTALIFQSGISKQRGGRRHNPYAFTEQGVAMLSSVLRSERAVQVNVAIMRAFVSLRRMLATNVALARKMAELERHLEGQLPIRPLLSGGKLSPVVAWSVFRATTFSPIARLVAQSGKTLPVQRRDGGGGEDVVLAHRQAPPIGQRLARLPPKLLVQPDH